MGLDRPLTDTEAAAVAALRNLERSATTARDAVAVLVRQIGTRRASQITGLPATTCARWRYDTPPSETLRTASERRRDYLGDRHAD